MLHSWSVLLRICNNVVFIKTKRIELSAAVIYFLISLSIICNNIVPIENSQSTSFRIKRSGYAPLWAAPAPYNPYGYIPPYFPPPPPPYLYPPYSPFLPFAGLPPGPPPAPIIIPPSTAAALSVASLVHAIITKHHYKPYPVPRPVIVPVPVKSSFPAQEAQSIEHFTIPSEVKEGSIFFNHASDSNFEKQYFGQHETAPAQKFSDFRHHDNMVYSNYAEEDLVPSHLQAAAFEFERKISHPSKIRKSHNFKPKPLPIPFERSSNENSKPSFGSKTMAFKK